MVKFALPKNSKINPGKYHRNSDGSKNLKKFKVYRWNPEDGKNPSIDTFEVLEAAGTKWNFLPFKPGLVGGHCIGVDPYYLTHKAEQVGYNPQIILAGRRINDNMAKFLM